MLNQLRNGRFLLLLCIVSMLAAGVPAIIGAFQLIHLRDSVEQIERTDAVSTRARELLDALGHSMSSFTAISIKMKPDERAVLLEDADQYFAKLKPAITEFRTVAAGFLPDAEADKLSRSIAQIIHSWMDVREEVDKGTSAGESAYPFLKTLKNIRNAMQILVSLERQTTALAETATKTSFDRIERITLYLFFAMSGGALIGLIAVLGNYQFARSVRQTNKELLQKNVEIAERDHRSIAQNQRFDAALNNMSQGLCMFDREQRLIVCNERYASLYGLPSDLVKPGTTFREILQYRVDNEVFAGDSPEEYIDERVAAVTEEVSSTKIQTLTDGRIIAIFHQPMPGGGWVATHEDITELRKAEQAIRESEELFSKVFQASPAACAISNPDDGSHYDVNETWINLLGYTREEAMAHTVHELGVWVEPEARSRFVDQLTRQGSVRGYEAKFRNKSGAELDVLISGELVEVGGQRRLFVVSQDITDRKIAEEALLESEARFRAFFDNTPVCLNLKDTEGRYLLANKGYEEWWGCAAGDVIGKKAEEFQDDYFGVQNMSEAEKIVLETGVVHEQEISVKRPADERVCDRLLIKFPVKAADGSIAAIGTVAIDITERKQAEKALRESEQRFKDLVETTNVVPWEFDPRTMRFTYVGPQAVNLFGYPIDTWYSDEFWLDVMHPEDREETASTCQRAVERGEDHELQYRMMTADGRELWVRDIVTVVDGGTDAMMLRGLFIDITILKLAEQKIRASQQRFRDIVETASDWIWECDADLRYTFLSERYTEMTGLPVEAVIGRTRQEISRGAQVDPGSDWNTHFADLEARRPFRDFRYNIKTSSGETLHFSISGTPVFDDSGKFTGYRGTGADATAERQAQAELVRNRDRLQEMVETATADLQAKAEQLRHALEREKQLNEQQRQFISMASHEFRTPLAVIDGLVQRMIRRKDKLLPDELEMRANKIRGAVGTITTLMESTLTAAKMDSGKISISVGTLDLRRTIEEICRRQLLVDGDHKILRDLDGLPETVIGDRAALDQVFTNLLSNAMKYSPDGTDVTVRGWCEGDTVVVSVQDKGLGIDEDDLPKMFTRFFRAKTSTGIPGTGIGLNLVKALVELHDGEISVQSRKGLGSIFTVRLPVNGPSHRERSENRAA